MFLSLILGTEAIADDHYYDVTKNSKYQEYEEEVARAKAAGEVQYYDTPEEAIENHDFGEEDKDLSRIDQVLMKIEDEDGIILTYLTKRDDYTQILNICKIGKEIVDGKQKYYYYVSSPTEEFKPPFDNYRGDEKGGIEAVLKYKEVFAPHLNINKHKRFICGIHHLPNIYSLKIEGQPPTGIVPYDFFGTTQYFWYYDDLKAEKPCAQMEFTIDPLPDYRSYLWINQQSIWTRIKLFFEWLF